MKTGARWPLLILVFLAAGVVEYQFGDLLLDSKTNLLTPLSKVLGILTGQAITICATAAMGECQMSVIRITSACCSAAPLASSRTSRW